MSWDFEMGMLLLHKNQAGAAAEVFGLTCQPGVHNKGSTDLVITINKGLSTDLKKVEQGDMGAAGRKRSWKRIRQIDTS